MKTVPVRNYSRSGPQVSSVKALARAFKGQEKDEKRMNLYHQLDALKDITDSMQDDGRVADNLTEFQQARLARIQEELENIYSQTTRTGKKRRY